MRKARTLLLTSLSLSFSSTGFADWQTEGFVGLTADLYKDEAQMGQCCDTLANRALIAPRLLWWNDSGWAATFSPYAEYEFQSEQGFINLREANITYAGETIEWLLGYGVVYWGVTEVYQPVNVVNQYDGRIALGYEEKIGQPMLQARWLPDWGDVQMLLLPFHQPRKFREPDQRRTLIKPVDDDANYSDGENALDSAIRIGFWQDALDVGISAFYGNSREPLLVESPNDWQASYARIFQLGTELQWTQDDLLLKWEGTFKSGEGSGYFTLVTGFEYSVYGFSFSQGTLGLIAEYAWDNRDTYAPPTIYNNDAFLGLRWQANDVQDTEFLLSGLFDLEQTSPIYKLNASGRINEHWKWIAEGYYLSSMSNNEPIAYLENDSYFSIGAEYYF
ncbi:malate transporter [Vibrio owensii]|uniref:malate transporter n=1 Tax=Vibrio owensii TaxID=696485 RepID=UPI0039093A53